MSKTAHVALAAALAVGAATSAEAVTFTPNVNNQFSIIFDVVPDQNEETGDFQIGFDFNISIDWDNGGNTSLGYFVDQGSTRLVTSTAPTTCSGTSGPENCDLIFASQGSPLDIGSGLPAGFYNFGVFGTTTTQGPSTVTFTVSKVPLPAAGLLLLGALGGAAAMRRHRRSIRRPSRRHVAVRRSGRTGTPASARSRAACDGRPCLRSG